jgi:hypothetical protein
MRVWTTGTTPFSPPTRKRSWRGKPSANGTHKPVNRLPAKLPAAKASGDVRLDDLQRIKALAADVGGMDRLHALTAFLMDLTRDAA